MAKNMISSPYMFIFKIVMNAEMLLAKVFHTTYNTINIIVYYLIIPLSWTILVVSRPSKCNVSFLRNVFLTQMLGVFSANLFVC